MRGQQLVTCPTHSLYLQLLLLFLLLLLLSSSLLLFAYSLLILSVSPSWSIEWSAANLSIVATGARRFSLSRRRLPLVPLHGSSSGSLGCRRPSTRINNLVWPIWSLIVGAKLSNARISSDKHQQVHSYTHSTALMRNLRTIAKNHRHIMRIISIARFASRFCYWLIRL